MASNNAELLIKITRKAPWILDEDKSFFPECVQDGAQHIIDSIKDFNMTIVTESGRVFKQYLIIKAMDSKVLIDKPFEWDDSVSSFHLFFKNRNNLWNFFHASGAKSDQDTISIETPDIIYLLQKRRFKRALTPLGTKVLFKNDSKLIDSAFVHDISEGGMLIWTGSPTPGYPVDSIMHEIFISLPAGKQGGETNKFHRVLPYITKGKIVRKQTDQSSLISHYGVSFIHDNIPLNKRFNSLIADLRKEFSAESHEAGGLNVTANNLQKISPSPLSY